MGTELERKSKLQKKGNCHLEARLQNKLERKLAIFPYQEEQEVSFLCLTKRRNSWETRIAINPPFERSVAMRKIKVGTKRNWAPKETEQTNLAQIALIYISFLCVFTPMVCHPWKPQNLFLLSCYISITYHILFKWYTSSQAYPLLWVFISSLERTPPHVKVNMK